MDGEERVRKKVRRSRKPPIGQEAQESTNQTDPESQLHPPPKLEGTALTSEHDEDEYGKAEQFPPLPPGRQQKDQSQLTPEKEEEQTAFDISDFGMDINDADFHYDSPPKYNALPDLYRLMETLEGGDTELEAKLRRPPSLFTRPEHVHNREQISKLRLALEDEHVDPYLDTFEDGVRDDVVMLASISLDEVQEEEQTLRDEHIRYLDQEAKRSLTQQEQILYREEQAKTRVAKYVKERRAEIKKAEDLLKQKERLLMTRLHQAFHRSESQLVHTLEKRKGEVKKYYGDLMIVDGQYGGSRGRRWKVDWNRTPQPVQIKLKCLRGVKDKLPGGRYVLMTSLYNRLGGHVLRWSKERGQIWGGATLPIRHEGHFYNVEMKLDRSMFTSLPPKASLRPGMVLVFELFILRGSVVPTDRVVGWGCFPICDGQFEIVEGKYKCPFLRGELDPLIDKHDKIEELIASDIDHWLCNIYFEIVKLPRYLGNQKEYEVELQFSSGLTTYPDRVRTNGEEYRDGEKPIAGSQSQLGSDYSLSNDSLMSPIATGSEYGADKSEVAASKVSLYEKDFALQKKGLIDFAGPQALGTTIGSRLVHREKKVELTLDKLSDESDSEADYFVMKKEEDFRKVENMPGMYYKLYQNHHSDIYHRKLYSMLPQTSAMGAGKKKRQLTHIEELEQHSFAVKKPFSNKGRLARSTQEKLQYVARQFLSELGLSQWRSREFWGMMLFFVIVFFMRMYLHYIGQWLYLNAITIPINKFNFLPYTVELNYQSTLLQSHEEIGVVVLGPLLNLLVFILLTVLAWISQKMFGLFPDIGSKFVIAFGIFTVLDPILVVIIDSILLRYEESAEPVADFAKLWWHFYRLENSGLAGLFITVFLYIFIMFFAGSMLYMYFLRLHNNGRMLDVFWRLHGDEDNFFFPYDLELSNQEVSYLVKKAEQWRGEEGERRKVAVYDYVWEEEDMDESIWEEHGAEEEEKKGRKETTTHVSVHTLHLDGLRELYRHFLRLSDGAIVEVFGDMSVPGMDKDVKNALEKGSQDVEKLLGSQVHLGKVRGRQSVMTRSGFRPDEDSMGSSSSLGSTPKKKKLA